MTNGRQGAMAGMHDGVLVQGPQLGVDGTGKQIKITAGVGNIGSTDGARKERVPDEDVVGTVFNLNQQTTPPKGVSGCVQHTEFKGAKVVYTKFYVKKPSGLTCEPFKLAGNRASWALPAAQTRQRKPPLRGGRLR